LHYTPAEWDALPWHHQRMFVEGMEQEGLITRGDPDLMATEAGIGHRKVNTGEGVIDLMAMKAELAGGR
jgi:hypothetical protein